MADTFPTTPKRCGTIPILWFLSVDIPRLLPDIEVSAEQATPGILVFADIIERMLVANRVCNEDRFRAASQAHDAAVLSAAPSYHSSASTPDDLVRISLDQPVAVNSERWMSSTAARLGLPG